MRKLILASASPRRKEILKGAGLKFKVVESPYEEEFFEALSPEELALTLSAHKAAPVARDNPETVVLAADTLVALDDVVMGKPENEAEARQMLKSLSGRMHMVVTGFTVQCNAWGEQAGKTVSQAVITLVKFKELTQEDIAAYVATGEPMDKAGAYGIQDRGGQLVESVDGDYLNVVGLPLAEVVRVLEEFGIRAS